MSLFFRIYQHLLPRARAWSLVVDKTLRRYFEGLVGPPSDFKDYIDQVWLDVFPETTRELPTWETQFGIISPSNSESARRDTVAAAWARGGGMGPDTLQDVLQGAGFPLFVHEAWYFDPAKQIRNPNLWLVDGDTTIVYVVECGEPAAECGEPTAVMGDTSTPAGTLLVNKILQRDISYLSAVTCGDTGAECGEASAQCGENSGFSTEFKKYILPSNPDLWPYFWYVGGAVFGDSVSIPIDRQGELEALVLKIGPAHLWAGLFVSYSS